MKRFLSVLALAAFLGLSFVAYKYRRDHRAVELEAENEQLQKKIEELQAAGTKQALDGAAEVENLKKTFAAEKETIKKALVIVMPDQAKVVENAFTPRKEEKAKAEAKTEAPAEEAKQ